MIMQDLTPSPHVVRGLALARCARTPCCLVRLACLRVALVEREVPRHECDSVAVLGRELGERHLHTRGAGQSSHVTRVTGAVVGPMARAPAGQMSRLPPLFPILLKSQLCRATSAP